MIITKHQEKKVKRGMQENRSDCDAILIPKSKKAKTRIAQATEDRDSADGSSADESIFGPALISDGELWFQVCYVESSHFRHSGRKRIFKL